MSLNHLAKHVQSQGRGKDTMLVHMSPREVNGLQALAMAHGGSLSINPNTGLPEAGFLENILPTLAGVALSFVPGVGPLAAAGLVGGGTALSTGSLEKGILAGFGAYGGAGLTDVIGNMGANALASNPEVVASQLGVQGAATGPGSQAAMLAAQNAGMGSAGLEAVRSAAGTAAGVGTQAALPTIGQQIGAGAAQQFMPSGSFNPADAASGAFNLAKQNPGTTVAALMPPVFGMGPNTVKMPQTQEEKSKLKRISPDFEGQFPTPNYYTPSYPVYGASGGVVALADGGQPSGPVERMSMMGQQPGMYPMGMIDRTYYATPSQRPAGMEVVKSDYDTPVNSITGIGPQFASGGISNLGGYSDGGRLLKGPGDGVSDDIPAQIGERQPARLADGEFVVPARIVSEIGNGSTEAGARKLYAMMDRVQKARRKSMGKGKHAVDSKAEKLLPV